MRHSPLGAASTRLWSSSSPWVRRRRDSRSEPYRKNSSEVSRFQPPPCTLQEEKRKEESGKRSKREEQPVAKWAHQRQVGAVKAFRLVLFLILLGTRMQTVKAVEEEISIRQEMDRILEKVLVPRADSSSRCRRMKFCESEWKEEGDWQERKRRNSQGKFPRTLEDDSQVRTQELLKNIAR